MPLYVDKIKGVYCFVTSVLLLKLCFLKRQNGSKKINSYAKNYSFLCSAKDEKSMQEDFREEN